MKLPAGVNRIFDRSLDALLLLAAILLAFVMLSINYEVVMRYFLNRPVLWALDVTQWCLVWITFLGAATVLRMEGHVKMDIVINRLNPKTQTVLNTVTSIVCAVLCLVVIWYGVQTTWDHFLRSVIETAAVEAPKALLMVIIPVGSFLLFIQFLRRTYGFLGGRRVSSNKGTNVVKDS